MSLHTRPDPPAVASSGKFNCPECGARFSVTVGKNIMSCMICNWNMTVQGWNSMSKKTKDDLLAGKGRRRKGLKDRLRSAVKIANRCPGCNNFIRSPDEAVFCGDCGYRLDKE